MCSRRAVALACIAFLPWLVALAFTRPYADDFCTVAATQGDSWGFMVAQYANWSGRYSSMLTSAMALQIGSWFTPILIAALFAAWWLSLRKLTDPMLATSALLVMLAIAPDPFEAYYWLTGALTYLAPLVLATWVVVLIEKPALCGLLAFVGAGFSDLGALLMLGTFGALAVMYRRRYIVPALAALGGLALIMLAPGNAVRQAYFPPPNVGASALAATFAVDDVLRASWLALALVPLAGKRT